jgi:transcription antitermination factor NusG
MDELQWYAIRVFWNRTEAVKDMLDERGIEYYAQTVMPAYIFVHTTQKAIVLLRQTEYNRFYVYVDMVTRAPLPIPEREIEIFKIVTSAASSGFEFLGDDPSVYRKGDLVRVTDGPFKGAEGYIKRIRKDRRLVVTISGVAAIATAHIPMELLEKVQQ